MYFCRAFYLDIRGCIFAFFLFCMKYSKKYIHFINGRYVNEGVRITAGIVVPSFVMSYFNLLPVGFVVSLGALCVSVADTPGAVKHRFNGMFACCLLVTAISVLVSYAAINITLLALLIAAAGFFFSMLTVYGNRSAAVGLAAMIVMVLSLQTVHTGIEIWQNAGYILAGGSWYIVYSLLLYRLRPYKFIQQVLGDYIFDVAAYLKLRGDLYAAAPDYEKINSQLLQQQISIEAQENVLGDLLLNTRAIVKESTHIGRVLVKISLEVADLYESVMTTYQQYSLMHEHFDNTGILQSYQHIIYQLATEMEEISLAIKSGFSAVSKKDTDELVIKTRNLFELLRQDYMKDENVENFVSLGRIQSNLEAIAAKVNQLHLYKSYEVSFQNEKNASRVLGGMLATQDLRPSLFINNLHFGSNIFRHSVRVALALLVGYLASLLFHADHGYWILLTIVVILKPAYSLSKRRNSDRLIGTVAGILIGVLILFFIKNLTVLWVILILFMAGSYMFIRTNYFLSVLLMTTYLLIFFQYLYPGNVKEIVQERILDTVIGSVVAFFASLFLIPAWEKNSIRAYMIKMLEANQTYFTSIASYFVEKIPVDEIRIKIARRQLLIALANLSDAFTRMLSEPKRYQQNVQHIHRFVSINHAVIAHLASLSYLLQKELNSFRSVELMQVIEVVKISFDNAIAILSGQHNLIQQPDDNPMKKLNEKIQVLLAARKLEITQGNLETSTKKSLAETKSVLDQFNFIFSNAGVLCKITKDFEAGKLDASR